MPKLRIFVVHGRDLKTRDSFVRWFRRNSKNVEPITFSEFAVPGSTIPSELERIATLGDAALVIATPDDLGGLMQGAMQSRARQNVWIELGWFWARLGSRRTLLIIKGDVDIPTDLSGVLWIQYENSIQEIRGELIQFLNRIQSSGPESLTEMLSVSAQLEGRSRDFQSVYDSAEERAILLGIGMANHREYLPRIFKDLTERRTNLKVDFVVLDRHFFDKHSEILSESYRPRLSQDIYAFEQDLRDRLHEFPKASSRVRLFRYKGIITYGCAVADPGHKGSRMYVESYFTSKGSPLAGRPRMLVAYRCNEGIYESYLDGIERICFHSDEANDLYPD